MDEFRLLYDFGRNLRDLLKEARISQSELSMMTGIPKSNISQYITGTQMPSLKNVVSIMIALNCEFDDLVDY